MDENADAAEVKSKTLLVPASTALAYTEYELQISKESGQFSLVLDRSRRGGFVASLSVDLDDVDGPSGMIVDVNMDCKYQYRLTCCG